MRTFGAMSDSRKKRKRLVAPLLKRPVGRPPKPLPERIPDDPENIVRILMRTPPPAEFKTNGTDD